jgi:hypothetical protein
MQTQVSFRLNLACKQGPLDTQQQQELQHRSASEAASVALLPPLHNTVPDVRTETVFQLLLQANMGSRLQSGV